MYFRASLRAVVCSLLSGIAVLAQPAEPRRLALLIGNSAYQKLTPLDSPRYDLPLLRDALTSTKFQVTMVSNVTTNDLSAALDKFFQGVKTGDHVLIFYSGYAQQSAGDNVLLPVEFDSQSQTPLPTRGVSLTRINEDLDDRKPALRILLLDASRDEKSLARLGL